MSSAAPPSDEEACTLLSSASASASDSSASTSNDDSDSLPSSASKSKRSLNAFDGIASSRPSPFSLLSVLSSRSPLCLPVTALRGCCCFDGFKCERVGSSRICNKTMYRRNKTCITGPHFPALIFIIVFVISCTYFFGFYVYDALNRANPIDPNLHVDESRSSSKLVHKTICVVFCSLTLLFLLMTGCTDPGILHGPKTLPPEVVANEKEYRTWRYCDVCEIFQPPKAAHCNDCGSCIAELDHHCPWMGKCVGKGNMKHFVRFNVSWVLFLIYVIIGVWFGI